MTRIFKTLLIATLALSTAGCYHTVQFDKIGGAHWSARPGLDAQGVPR
jgi:hypothetical protein